MAASTWLKYVYRAHLSRPKSVRPIYRVARRNRVQRIVELGIADLGRTVRIIDVAQRYAPAQQVNYVGIDWFETRPASMRPLTLKQAYRALQATDAKVRLVPGEPGGTLATVANAQANTGLLLISSDVSDESLAAAWFYVPRMLGDSTVVLRERPDSEGKPKFERLTACQLVQLAESAGRRRAA